MTETAADQDAEYQQIKQQLQLSGEENQQGYEIDEDGMLLYKKRLYVPNKDNLKNLVLDEFHISHYAGHPDTIRCLLHFGKNTICLE